MANPAIPGVIINVNDQSAVPRVNISTNFCMIGAFERGDDINPFLIGGGEAQFQKLCGSVDNALDQLAYVSAIQMLKYAQGIWMINVTKNALFGGISVTTDAATGFATGKSAFSYAFTTNPPYTGTLAGSSTGPYILTIPNVPVEIGSLVVSYTIAATPYTATDDGEGNVNGTLVETGHISYDNGYLIMTFDQAPDAPPTITYSQNLNEAFVLFANSKKSWSENYGVQIYDHTKYSSEIFAVGDNISTLVFSGTIKNPPLKKRTVKVTFTTGGVTITKTDDGGGTFGNLDGTDTYLDMTGNTINYTTGDLDLKFKSGKAPDDGTYILVSYSVDDGFFEIWEYQLFTDGSSSLLNKFLVSKDPTAKDQFLQSAYIEDVINNNSQTFKVIDNPDFIGDVPEVSTTVYMTGGADGIAPTDAEKAIAIQTIKANQQIDFSTFVGCGTANVGTGLIVSDVIDLLETKNATGVLDLTVPSDVSLTVQDIDDKNIVWYGQTELVTYNGKSYYVPMSAMDAAQYAKNIASNGQFYLPPNGITRGTLNGIKMNRYFNDAEVEILQNKRINVVRYFKSYGNVIFSNLTSQKKLSATTYRNSVLTLHDMIKTLNDSLLIVDFEDINTDTFRTLRTLISDYLDRLAKFKGTIESDYTLNIENINTAATKDAKKIYAELIFVFQSLAEQVILTLTYTSNQLYISMK